MHIVHCELQGLCISMLSVRIVVALVYMCHVSLKGNFVDLTLTIFIMSFIKVLVEYATYGGNYDMTPRQDTHSLLPYPDHHLCTI